MSKVKIGHAVYSENGTTTGEAGDQTGREIRIQDYYDRPWDTLLICSSPDMALKAASVCAEICESPLYGYSQKNRWAGYKAIKKAGSVSANSTAGDFDCSSLVISCYIFAGLDIKAAGYTGNLERILTETGKFTALKGADVNERNARPGAVYLSTGHHVCMALTGTAEISQYVKTNGSVRVREKPITGATLKIARNALLPFIGVDVLTGWYIVDVDGKNGYVTNNKRYAGVVSL